MHWNCQNHLPLSYLFNYKQVLQAFQTFSVITIIIYSVEIPQCVLKNSILLEYAQDNSLEIKLVTPYLTLPWVHYNNSVLVLSKQPRSSTMYLPALSKCFLNPDSRGAMTTSLVSWFNPHQRPSPTQLLAHSSASEWGREQERQK